MIHIIYRHTDNVSGIGKNRPSWFSYDKCLGSLIESVEEDPDCLIHIINDGTKTYDHSGVFHSECINAGSDWESYKYCWNYAKKLNIGERDLIFFAENDYLFVRGWSFEVKRLFDTYDGLDYISLYDHPHFYNTSAYPGLTTFIIHTLTHHWKTVPSSTGSIIISKRILDEDYDVHTTNASDRGRFEYLSMTKGRNVMVPIPSLSTHCEVEWLAPIIDWSKI